MSFEFSPIDTVWVILCAGLVFLMQAGFLCLETGMTRTKNSINVAVKNIADFGIGVFIFWLVGFGLMFGSSIHGWVGGSLFLLEFKSNDPWVVTFFIFQATFCGTAVTIVSGAVAERMRFAAYLWLTLFVALLIYPIFGHWAWGGALIGNRGWLAGLGFVDFAGSSVVHSVGGWVSLVAIFLIGPRKGRFLRDGSNREIQGQALPIAILGGLLLCFGWIGFNGGSTLTMDSSVPHIVANTFLGAVGGLLSMMFVGWKFEKYSNAKHPLNGLIAGLVSVTANCHIIESWQAVLIGALGGLIAYFLEKALEHWKLDDVVGAFPVHAGAGIWGTIAVALFGDLSMLGNGLNRMDQFGVQLLGVVVCCAVTVIPTYVFLRVFKALFGLRVGEEAENSGLNVSEHKATTEYLDLLLDMEIQAHSSDLDKRVRVEPFTEVGQIAAKYNEILESLQVTIARDEMIVRDTRDGIISCDSDGRILSVNPGAEKMLQGSEEELLKKSIWDFVGFDDDSRSLDSVFQNGGDHAQSTLRRRDGLQMKIEIEGTTRVVSDRTVHTLRLRDITEMVEYRKQMTVAKEHAETTRDELQEKMNQVEAFNKIAIDRELRMLELKDMVNRLSAELGQDPPFLPSKSEAKVL